MNQTYLVAAATLGLVGAFGADANAQQFSGTASGFVVAERGTEKSSITPGQHATNTFVGPMAAIPGSPVESTAPGGSAFASTSPGVNRALSDSRGTDPNLLHYAGSYWGEMITFTGGVGSFTLALDYGFEGAINDANGDQLIGSLGGAQSPVAGGLNTGEAAVRFRALVGGFNGNQNFSPSIEGSSFFLNHAVDDQYAGSSFDLPDVDNFPSGTQLNSDGSMDTIVFNPLDPSPGFDPNDPNDPELIAGPYTTSGGGRLKFYSSGARFEWEYGVPLAVGLFLETWATGGAVADFANTGLLSRIEVPVGTVVTSESGAVYPVAFAEVPEPATLAALGLAGIAFGGRRRPVG